MPAKLSHDVAEQRIQAVCLRKEITYFPFTYTTADKTLIKLQCNCGHMWSSTYNNILANNTSCIKCSYHGRMDNCNGPNRKKTQEESELIVGEFCNTKKYTYQNFTYVGSRTTFITLQCTNGHEWVSTFASISSKTTGCNACAAIERGKSKVISQEDAMKRVSERCFDIGYLFKPFIYVGGNTKLTLTCKHGHVFSTNTYERFIAGKNGCRTCLRTNTSIAKKKDDAVATSEVYERCAELGYTVAPFIYTNSRMKLTLTCDKGHTWRTTSHGSFIGKTQTTCPRCKTSESKNLKDVDKRFEMLEYVSEKKFDNCVYTFKLPFDRWVPSLNILLEYDGEQHFGYKYYWHRSKSGFEKAKKRDQIKTEYAINNGYNFIRIAYYEDHVAVLESFLKLIKDNPGKQIVQIYGDVKII